MWILSLLFQLKIPFIKIEEQSFFRCIKGFLFPGKQLWCLFPLTRAIKAVFLITCWGLINSFELVLIGHCKFSLSSSLQRNACLLPSWCLHYYLFVPPRSDRTRLLSQEALVDSPLIMMDTGRTPSRSHTIAGTLAHLVKSTLCLSVSDCMSCLSECRVTVAARAIFCLLLPDVTSCHQKKVNSFFCSHTCNFLLMPFNRNPVDWL